MDSARAVSRLHREAVMWLVSDPGLEAVVRAACDALAAGVDGEHLATLAGVSVRASESEADADALIHAALAEVGRPLPARHSAAAHELAVITRAEDLLRGRGSPRELAAWAHRVMGHGGVEIALPLVLLDDDYDCIEHTGRRVEDLDAEVLAYCQSLVRRRER